MKPAFENRLLWLLRAAVCLEFVGHGAFGIITKKAWIPYFGVVGIPPDWAWKLMPVIGAVDITAGLSALLWPCRALALYMTVWGFWTALLRPLAGEGIWELLERAGNYGVPLALLLYSQSSSWLDRLKPRPLDAVLKNRITWVLRLTTATLLVGHGAFGAVVQKPQLAKQLGSLGLDEVPITALGGFEIALGIAVLAQGTGPLLLFIFGWKVTTEILYPLSGSPIWEFVERGGSYAAPLALYLLSRQVLAERTNRAQSQLVPSEIGV
jgi:hypothetical protein